MMPGTAHRAINHQTFRQRAAVMRARCADGEKLFTASGHKNRFAEGVPQKHFTIAHVSGLVAFFKIRSLELAGFFSHKISPPCSIRIAPEPLIVLTRVLSFNPILPSATRGSLP